MTGAFWENLQKKMDDDKGTKNSEESQAVIGLFNLASDFEEVEEEKQE